MPTDTAPVPDRYRETARAIERLSGRDRVGVAGQALATVGGAAGGVAAAGAVAAAAGATTIFGSTTLGGLLGGVFVASTPVGWVIGMATACGAAAYAVARLVRSGGRSDRIREEIIGRLKQRAAAPPTANSATADLDAQVARAIDAGRLSAAQGLRMVRLVDGGKLDATTALRRIAAVLEG